MIRNRIRRRARGPVQVHVSQVNPPEFETRLFVVCAFCAERAVALPERQEAFHGFERTGDDEISISVAGSWTDYHVSFSWMEDFEALHLACAFDIKVPEARALEVMRLLSLINEQMLFGHFDLWEQEGAIMFRQSLLLAGGAEPTSQQVEVLLSSALEACECYFQSFQFVVWSGTSARDALASVLFETQGNA
jgi:hypothetical protein